MTELCQSLLTLIVGACLLRASSATVLSSGNFMGDFFVMWSPSHVNTSADGQMRSLFLDKDSGAGFESNDMFLFGKFEVQIKLIPGYSAGTVVAFYLASDQPNHDEIDFEFLGNVLGQPYIFQTNVFVDGFGDREDRVVPWFDPTKEFHNYTILWNIYEIVFFVDSIPIRTYRNHVEEGVPYPKSQPMSVKVTIWNGESWATGGGRDKIDWSKAPFVASFAEPHIDACIWEGEPGPCRASDPLNWWNGEGFNSLSTWQRRWFKWVRLHHRVYDYCQDYERFQYHLPRECNLTSY
ncbi:hypothetical protein MLD38_032414 [Melastoma candidum]|uniref:Uncharacterized protein n=1 Tax=Melastoma candidum TaxID=119954 RepID=A0ACB9M5Z9_9MYRT|nr:hypothetical protein MLD38_032414 [Melastoma candidum]